MEIPPKASRESAATRVKEAGLTFNWPLIGNYHIKSFLVKALVKDQIGGTYIFYGPDNLGKTTAAISFSQLLLCENKRERTGELPCRICPPCKQFKYLTKKAEIETSVGAKDEEAISSHGDFHLIKKDKDKKNISIEQVRELINILGLSSFLNSYKIGIIKHAEYLSEGAANALLKTLEEPKDKVVIILVVTDIERLPKTIVSRGQNLEFKTIPSDEIYDFLVKDKKTTRSTAKNISRLVLGRPALAMKFLEDKDFYEIYQARLKIFLDFFKQDLNERISSIGEALVGTSSNQEQVRMAYRMIEIWQGLARDMILLSQGQRDLIQHEMFGDEIDSVNKRHNIDSVTGYIKALEQAKHYLQANVSPKLVLENIAINI